MSTDEDNRFFGSLLIAKTQQIIHWNVPHIHTLLWPVRFFLVVVVEKSQSEILVPISGIFYGYWHKLLEKKGSKLELTVRILPCCCQRQTVLMKIWHLGMLHCVDCQVGVAFIPWCAYGYGHGNYFGCSDNHQICCLVRAVQLKMFAIYVTM